jgi:hypothetical protein
MLEVASLSGDDSTPSIDASLSQVTNWLRRVGDFESIQQNVFFSKGWEQFYRNVLTATQGALDVDTWLLYASAEIHLRHFVWFWLTSNARKLYRENLWLALAAAWTRLPKKDRDEAWSAAILVQGYGPQASVDIDGSARTLLDFALGAYEVFAARTAEVSEAAPWLAKLADMRSRYPGSIGALRATIARRVWEQREANSALLLLDAGAAWWEGMEAKIALDILERRLGREVEKLNPSLLADEFDPGDFVALRHSRDFDKEELWHHANDVRGLARVAGCTRREIGAVTLGSFVVDTERAVASLLAAYRRLLARSAGSPEPTTAWSVAFGLIAALVDRSSNDSQLSGQRVAQWLTEKCERFPTEPYYLQAAADNYLRYWGTFHLTAQTVAYDVLNFLGLDFVLSSKCAETGGEHDRVA